MVGSSGGALSMMNEHGVSLSRNTGMQTKQVEVTKCKDCGEILNAKRDDNALTQDTTLNRPALLEAHKSAQGVPEGGLGADDSTIGQRLLFPDAIELVGSAQQ